MSSIEDRLDSTSEPWRPSPGDKLIGTVVDLDERDGDYGSYPIVVVRTDAGEQLAFHAFHTVAKSELAKARPRIGEAIGIKYVGRPDGKTYELYRVAVVRDDDQRIDWDRIGAEAEAEAVETGGPDATASEQTEKEADSDGFPFTF